MLHATLVLYDDSVACNSFCTRSKTSHEPENGSSKQRKGTKEYQTALGCMQPAAHIVKIVKR